MRARNLSALLALGMAACTEASTPASEDVHGSLSLALIGADSHGHTYRLRNAEFQVYGCPDNYPYYPYATAAGSSGSFAGSAAGGGAPSSCTDTILSSEDDPNSGEITKRLIPGYYNVTLYDGWHLEELTAQGAVAVDKAVLLSQTTQYTYVWDRGQTQVFYSFGAGGDLIDFRHGDLTINIAVEQPGDRDCYDGDAGNTCGGAGGSAGRPAPVDAGAGGAPAPVDAGAGGAPAPQDAGAAGSF